MQELISAAQDEAQELRDIFEGVQVVRTGLDLSVAAN
jgi:hypothetical protein